MAVETPIRPATSEKWCIIALDPSNRTPSGFYEDITDSIVSFALYTDKDQWSIELEARSLPTRFDLLKHVLRVFHSYSQGQVYGHTDTWMGDFRTVLPDRISPDLWRILAVEHYR